MGQGADEKPAQAGFQGLEADWLAGREVQAAERVVAAQDAPDAGILQPPNLVGLAGHAIKHGRSGEGSLDGLGPRIGHIKVADERQAPDDGWNRHGAAV